MDRSYEQEKDFKKTDLEILLASIRIIERLDSNEYLFLKKGICPKCGGKLGQRQIQHGGGPEEPPHSLTYISGCLDCDYELNRETIHI